MEVTLGPIRFEEWPRNYDDAFLITRDGLKGWLSGLTMRRDETARPWEHGAFDAPGLLPARGPSIEGVILATSELDLVRKIAQLTGLLADGQAGRMMVQSDSTTWADVRLAGCNVSRHPSGLEADFQLQLWAPDPRRYGEARTFTGEAAYHWGNFPATPRLMIGAGTGGYTVTGPDGRQVVVTTAPAAAHYIDFADGGLFTSAGVRQVGAISTYQPWTVPPGARVAASISGTRTLGQRVKDTFI